MAKRDWIGTITDPVDAEFELTERADCTFEVMFMNCRMTGILSAPGMDPVVIEHTSMAVPTKRWPHVGQVLPVTVERDDVTRMRVRWTEVPVSGARPLARSRAR